MAVGDSLEKYVRYVVNIVTVVYVSGSSSLTFRGGGGETLLAAAMAAVKRRF